MVSSLEFMFEKFVTNQLFGWDGRAVPLGTFYHHQDYQQFNFYKSIASLYRWSIRPRRARHNLFENGSNLDCFKQNLNFFYQHSQPFHDVMQKKIANLEFVQCVNFEFLESIENNDTKYLLTSDDLFEESCNSKFFIICATAEKHLGLNTIYTKHNLFHQSKVARDVEPRNTHIVVFKSPYEVM